MESGDVGELHFTKKPLLQWHSRTSTTSRMNKRWWNHTMNELPLTFSTCMPSYYDIYTYNIIAPTESMNTNVGDKIIWLWPPLAKFVWMLYISVICQTLLAYRAIWIAPHHSVYTLEPFRPRPMLSNQTTTIVHAWLQLHLVCSVIKAYKLIKQNRTLTMEGLIVSLEWNETKRNTNVILSHTYFIQHSYAQLWT